MNELKPYTRGEVARVAISRKAVSFSWPIVLGAVLHVIGGTPFLIFALLVLVGAFAYNRAVSK